VDRNISGIRGIFLAGKRHKIKKLCWTASIKVKGKGFCLISSTDFCEVVCYRLAAEQCTDWDSFKHQSTAFEYVKKHIQPNLRK
jgi:hypothetical protein